MPLVAGGGGGGGVVGGAGSLMLPPPPPAHTIGSPACASVALDGKTVAWAGERADGVSARRFTFDYAAGERVGQEELFENVSFVCLFVFFGVFFFFLCWCHFVVVYCVFALLRLRCVLFFWCRCHFVVVFCVFAGYI